MTRSTLGQRWLFLKPFTNCVNVVPTFISSARLSLVFSLRALTRTLQPIHIIIILVDGMDSSEAYLIESSQNWVSLDSGVLRIVCF